MIHKSTEDKIKELGKCIEQTEDYKQRLLDTDNPRDAALIGIKVSQMREELKGSYTEQTPLWEVQGLIEKETDTIHDKALAIQRELCRIYRIEEYFQVKCYGCPLCIVDSNGNDDECFKALKQHLVCQYLTTQFHV